jgi:diadenosine tetraphosphate (Ap4A) HIT family hydrolase
MQDCPFCNIDREIIMSSDLCFAVYDKFPVSAGHVLVIPKRHVRDYFELDIKELASLWEMVTQVKTIIDSKYKPQGYNIGFNVGESAGQTVNHVHIHVIPRYRGDMEDPAGGVRHVIPGKVKY